MKPRRIEVLGVPVDCVDMRGALEAVDAMMAASSPQTIVAVNPEKVIRAQTDANLLQQLRSAGLLIPDGIGVVAAAAILGLGKLSRVPGSELMPAICERAAQKGYRIFLYGASPQVNAKTKQVLEHNYRGIKIVGNQHGYVSDAGMAALLGDINASGAQILFVALGSPRQELWMEQHLSAVGVKVCQGVGGTFDVIAGRVRRAPAIFLKWHLEWFYRLAVQPSRILRQTALPRFVLQVLRKRVLG
jgi:N-acetylglucosaminyldiphosphoundecaprenol N-acetyl-beta-D-mannosaminyltransferase